MTENSEAQVPESGIPQAVTDEISALAREVKEIEQSSIAGSKSTLVVFAVILVIVAVYLFGFILPFFRENATPENITELVFNTVDQSLQNNNLPKLESTQWVSLAAKELEKAAPQVIEEHVKPALKNLQDQIPRMVEDGAEQFKDRAPELFDDAVAKFETTILPNASDTLLREVGKNVDGIMDKFDEALDAAMMQVIDEHQLNAEALSDMSKLEASLTEAMESKLGPHLDSMFADIHKGIDRTAVGVADLQEKYDAGTLTHKEKLEVRLIQLVVALYRGVQPEPGDIPTTVE